MNVPLTRLEVPDYDLGLRGKLVRADKATASSALAFCTIVHGLSLTDDVTDTRTSNAANGYPDARVELDESTRVDLPWLPGHAQAVIGDLVTTDGEPIAASARGHLVRLRERYAKLGLEPTLGFEFELWLLDASTGKPIGATENAYSLDRLGTVHALAAEFMDRMEMIDAPVEAFHSELGPGFFEFALKPQPVVKAADGAARARQYLRDLCVERGLRASFMAKPYAGKSGAGGHVHSSLGRGTTNVFASAPGVLSADGEHYLAGLLVSMADFTVLFNPFVNSYKRLDKEMFVAESAAWGSDDRSVALRVLLDTVSGARVEHRRPGADVNPYLSALGLIAGGLVGLEQHYPLPPAGHAAERPLPGDMVSAIEAFESSAVAKDLLGEDFVGGFAATRRSEWHRYERWLSTTVTEWESQRYGVHL